MDICCGYIPTVIYRLRPEKDQSGRYNEALLVEKCPYIMAAQVTYNCWLPEYGWQLIHVDSDTIHHARAALATAGQFDHQAQIIW